MPSLGGPEIAVIAVVVLILFGAGKLGEVGGALGKSIREFRRAASEEDKPRPPASDSQPPPLQPPDR